MCVQFPDCYEGPVAKLVHHATLKLDDLCQRLVAYFKDRFVPGEEVLGVRDEIETACRIIAAVDPTDLDHDCELFLYQRLHSVPLSLKHSLL